MHSPKIAMLRSGGRPTAEREREREDSKRRNVKMDEIGRNQQNMFRTKRTAMIFQITLI